MKDVKRWKSQKKFTKSWKFIWKL